ncbi:hypothetical protein DH2020_001690 [Rehmannia glutinosa]|uniref:E2F transcription factor CC-MB domain-containing protein n=1 Tax=Rehmannia glutinosa TaxID=99300 RepID=A0ABR0XSA7_REHGL
MTARLKPFLFSHDVGHEMGVGFPSIVLLLTTWARNGGGIFFSLKTKGHDFEQSNELGSVEVKNSGNARVQVPRQENSVNDFSSGPASCMGARCSTKAKSAKHAKSVAQEPKLEPVDNFNLTGCCRGFGTFGKEREDEFCHLKGQTVIAIEAPRASFVKVPDPDEDIGFSQKQYRLIVRSTTGPISVYLLRKNEKKSKDISIKRAKLMDPLAWTGSSRIDDADLCSSPCDTSTSSKIYGVQKIVPLDGGIDDDYWLRSDHEVSALDLWSTEEL